MTTELPIRITEESFHLLLSQKELDRLEGAEKELAQGLLEHKWDTLFERSLGSKPEKESSGALAFLDGCAADFLDDLLREPALEVQRDSLQVEPSKERIQAILDSRPLLRESSLIQEKWIRHLYRRLSESFQNHIRSFDGSVAKFFNTWNPALNPPESIFFHLVEHSGDAYPFAFLATYAKEMPDGKIRHVPLSAILEEYKGDQKKMLELLGCLNQAAEICPMIGRFMVSGELFHPLGLSPDEAFSFLKSVEDLEKAGIVCRIPNWWRQKRSSVSLNLKVGDTKPSFVGLDSLVSIKPSLSVDGQKLTQAEIRKILQSSEGLVLIKGKWVEADPARLKALLKKLEDLPDHMTLLDALRLQGGLAGEAEEDSDIQYVSGRWMASVFDKLSNPSVLRHTALPKALHATLRPYQVDGYNWLNSLSSLGFGALLADDMGLGKTVQTLAWLEKEHQKDPSKKALLIVPASLLGNWKKEAGQFTPDLDLQILHGKAAFDAFEKQDEEAIPFLNITTYGMAMREERIQKRNWDFVILDEAQAIKNPKTRQAQAIKKIQAARRLAMTGTPVENDLINLWSIFDFLNPGLLGSLAEFSQSAAKIETEPQTLNRLQTMISPFLLRRLKTDKAIISDLPEKIEQNDYITLSARQKVLYNEVIEKLEDKLRPVEGIPAASGIERSGLVLSTLTKLKQICNHPDQYLGQKEFSEKESGKFEMLREICEPIAENRESVLVFTQFREMTDALDAELESIFGARGFVIHGGTPAEARGQIVDAFNAQETYIPYVVLSLRAAGTGLNLTQANHVIHFDRWWNPAVENQATDRAFRIGQNKNVMVHKFVCENTVEERIDAMIRSKQQLADSVVASTTESWLTSMSDDELLAAMRMRL